jgi:type IV pilus assembly protein PilY1
VYALDVTDPNAMDASKVLCEVNSSTTGFGELGHVLSDVQAGLLPNGDWVAVFGNGFGSTSGQAWLYVVNLRTGALLKAISAGAAGGNGLGGVRAVLDANRRLVGVYGGDLKGNMWKFDLTGPQANWKVALSSNPLYAAGTTRPITATPAVLPHPSGGHVVTFGTGKFFETGDKDPPFANQRLYGIWDAQPFGASSTPAGAWLSGLSQLVAQTITSVTDGSTTVTFYRISANSIEWGDGLSSGNRGWYIDLPHSGQRVAYPVERMAGTLVMASTLSPVSPVEADLCVQTGSGSGWVYVIDGVTGAGATKAILDTNGDGHINDSDLIASGWQDPVDGRPTALTTARRESEEEVCIVTAQNTCTELRLRCGIQGMPPCPIPPPPGLKSREWRQLFMR